MYDSPQRIPQRHGGYAFTL